MKYPYDDSTYYPAAPVVEIYLGVPSQSLSLGPIRALVDTGADISFVSVEHIKQLKLPIDARRFVRGQWGEPRPVDIYSVDLGIAGARLPAIEVAADESGGDALLGRNVLNNLTITLDGPRRTLDVRA